MAKKSLVSRNIDAEYLGTEPDLEGKTPSVSELIVAYSWYGYAHTLEEGLEFLIDYLKSENRPVEFIRKCDKNDIVRVGTSVVWNARILMNNGILPDDVKAGFDRKVEELAKLGKIKAETPVTTATVRDRIESKASDLIGRIDEAYDTDRTFDVAEYVSNNNISPVVAKIAVDKFTPVYMELVAVLEGKDAELLEGYRGIKKAEIRANMEWWKSVIAALSGIKATATPVTRKPRRKKVKPASKVVAKVKYAKETGDFKSISPQKIVGADQLWVYNTKTRMLGVYKTMGGGLNVKGTTIVNFDPATAIAKKLRKPEEQIKAFSDQGKVGLRTFLDKIKAKPQKLTGRINSDTVLLRVL